ncbi:hypothetical protein HHL11_10070 [Ramlibacter sp. G-1-2-2]|uniref:Uncharacterized protein n=1 Tax=Ramlibacter agri TaxID=2728837 RepID=A0A848GZV6_9BURK|nr:hypothetical protein [Ramlibacter agri]NML44095.1 hypothetical protein [Ramlibacter agri]
MTFCLAFSANPDGIAVVSDTRITLTNGYQDGFQKTIFPTENSFISVAGSVGTLLFVLDDVARFIQQAVPEGRIDALRNRLSQRFRSLTQLGRVTTEADFAFVIYGDVKLQKGPTRCRLVRFDLVLSESGEPVLHQQTASEFAAEEAKKFPDDPRTTEFPWLCIGTIPGTRNFIGNTAMSLVRDYSASSLEFVPEFDEEAVRAIKASARVHHQVAVRATSKPYTRSAVGFDMRGKPDGTFRKKLRAYANEQERKGVRDVIDVIQVLGMAALKQIEFTMAEIPGAIGLESVSETWSLATISRRSGTRLCTSHDPNGVTFPFKLRNSLR